VFGLTDQAIRVSSTQNNLDFWFNFFFEQLAWEESFYFIDIEEKNQTAYLVVITFGTSWGLGVEK
jgi:hypothetical protein